MSIFKSLIKSSIFLVFLSNYIYCTDSTGINKGDLEYIDVSINKKVKVKDSGEDKKNKTYKLALFLEKKKIVKKKKKEEEETEYIKITKIPKILFNIIKKEIKILESKINEDKVYSISNLFDLVSRNCRFLTYHSENRIVIKGFCIRFVNEKEEKKDIDVNIINFITSNDFTNIKNKKFDYMRVNFNDPLITYILNLKFIKKVTIVDDVIIYFQFYVDPDEFKKTFEYSYEIDKPDCYNSLGINEDTFKNIIDNFIEEKYKVKDICDIKFLKYEFYPALKVEELDFEIYFHNIEAKFENEKIKIKIEGEVDIKEDTRKNRIYPIYYESLFSKIDFNKLKLSSDFKHMREEERDNIFKLLKDNNFIKTVQSIDIGNIAKYNSYFYDHLIIFFKKYITFEEKQLKSIFEDKKIFEFFTFIKEENLEYRNIDDLIDVYLLENSIKKLKDFGSFIHIKENKCIIIDLKNKEDLKGNLIEFSNEKINLNDIRKKYKKSYSKIVSGFKEKYNFEKRDNFENKKGKSLKVYLEDILKKFISKLTLYPEAFIEYFDFSECYLDYIFYYCINILEKDNINSKKKEELIKFLKEIDTKNKMVNDVNLIKDKYIEKIKKNLNDNSIDDKYYESFKTDKLQDLFNKISEELLKTLSKIFVDEIIKNEKENVIDKISQVDIKKYISDLQDKKEEYNKQEGEHKKYSNIEKLLNDKNISEGNIEIEYKVEHINKIITELNEEINKKLGDNKETIINAFIESEKTKIKAFKDLNVLNNYLTNFNKDKDEAGSLKKSLKQYLIDNNFKEDDIKNEDYETLGKLTTCITDKQTKINEGMKKQMDDNNKNKLETIEKKINKICDEIIKEIEKITKREDIKNYKYKDNDSIINRINEELLVEIDDYNTFIKQKIGKNVQTYEVSINTTIGTKVTEIKNKYDERNGILSIVNVKYTLSDEDKITNEGKNEFNKLNVEKYKKFDSRKTYKDLFGTLKSVSAYFKNIDLVDSGTLASIENNDTVIDKDDITINIKLVDSCYKKDDPKDPKGDDRKDDEHRDPKDKDKDNEDSGCNNSETEQCGDTEIKENGGYCRCSNNKIKNKNSYCVKKSLSR